MDSERLKNLFLAYTQGIASEAEQQEFLELVRSAGQDNVIQEEIKKLWHLMAQNNLPPPAHADDIYRRILAFSEKTSTIKKAPSKLYRRIWLQAAAILLLTGLLGFWFYHTHPKKESANNRAETVENSDHGHRFISLPDGSTVLLHQGSQLRYPGSFAGKNKRIVHLSGQAYFDIHPQVGKPFVVYAGQTRITVLGTSFTVRSDSGIEKLTVTVDKGRVQVQDNRHDYGIVQTKQELRIDRAQANRSEIKTIQKAQPAWVSAIIYFDDKTLEQAAQDLEQHFGIHVVFKNPALQGCRFTAGFVKGENLEQIIKVISVFNQASYRFSQDQKTVYLSGEGCGNNHPQTP